MHLPIGQRLDSVPAEQAILSRWGFFKLTVKTDDADPGTLEVRMHTRIEKIRVERSEFEEFHRFQKGVAKSYRVWLALKPTIDIADAPGIEKRLAEKKYADAQAVKILARLYVDHDRLADARKLLDKALEILPGDHAIWDLRVSAAATVEEEERLYRSAVKQFPGEGRYGVSLGAALVRRGEQAEAQKVLTPLMTDSHPASVRGPANYQMARSLQKQKKSAAALKHLQAALIAEPAALASIDALHFKAGVQESLGQLEEAIQTLTTALDADPNSRDTLEFVIRLEMKADLKDAALGHLRRYAVAAAKDASSLVRAAELHLQMNRPEEALDLAKRALDLGAAAKAERILGLIHFARRDFAKAASHLERSDLDAGALSVLIEAALRTGDLDAARRRAESIPRMEGASKELLAQEKIVSALAGRRSRLLADWKVDANQGPAAERIVGKYLCAERGLAERWPSEEIERLVESAAGDKLDFGPMLAVRGWLHLEKGRVRQAIADASAAIKLTPTDSRAYLVRGRARLEQGKVKEALSDLRRATELSGREDATVLHWLAAALLDDGRPTEAIETQRLALLLRPRTPSCGISWNAWKSCNPKSAAASNPQALG